MSENLKVQTLMSMRIKGLEERKRDWICEPSMVVSDTGNVKLGYDFESSFKNYFVILIFENKQTKNHRVIYAITRLWYK